MGRLCSVDGEILFRWGRLCSETESSGGRLNFSQGENLFRGRLYFVTPAGSPLVAVLYKLCIFANKLKNCKTFLRTLGPVIRDPRTDATTLRRAAIKRLGYTPVLSPPSPPETFASGTVETSGSTVVDPRL